MLRRFRTWLRVVLPADYTLLGVVVFVLGLVALNAIRSKLQGADEWQDPSELPTLVLWISAVLYAAFRTYYFNPIENRPYGDWLADSPWRFPHALPLGPIHLVWQDLFVVGVLTMIFPSDLFPRLVVPTSFLLTYCFLLAYSQLRVGIYWSSFAVALLGGCFVLAIVHPWARLAIAAAMVPVVYFAVQPMLRGFPFEGKVCEWLRLIPKEGEALMTAGWPLPPKRQEVPNWSISYTSALMVSSAVGWLIFCAGFHFRENPEFENGMLRALAWVVGVSIIARLLIYIVGYVPPISLPGRIATGRLIILSSRDTTSYSSRRL